MSTTQKTMPKIDPDLVPYLVLIGIVMAATGALQMWLVTNLLWTG